MPIQFQLSLELASIVQPIIQGLSAVGSLALAGRVHRAGSDIITERKLEVLLVRIFRSHPFPFCTVSCVYHVSRANGELDSSRDTSQLSRQKLD